MVKQKTIEDKNNKQKENRNIKEKDPTIEKKNKKNRIVKNGIRKQK